MSNLMRLLVFQLFLLILFFIILKVQNTMSFGEPDPGAVDLQITIVKGDVKDPKHTLTLRHSGSHAWGLMKVKWVIAPGSNVEKFFITRKRDSPQVFKFYDTPPWPFYRHTGSATVKNISPEEEVEYIYAIHWKDTKGDTYCFDPKIAVKSNTKDDLDLLVYILYLILVTVSFLFRKKFIYK